MRSLRTGVCALAVLGLAASAFADGRRSLVVVSAEISASGATLFVSGRNPRSAAVTFAIEPALAEPGFTCPYPAYGTQLLNLAGRGVGVNVFYSDASVLDTHGGGDSVTNVVCTTP